MKNKREITYAEAINEGLRQAMELCSDVVVMGQLVDYKPGIFGTTKGLADRFGKDRVRDFPNAEGVMTSTAIGTALTGMRPVVVHPRIDFMMYGIDPMVNWLSLWRFKSNKKCNLPVTIRALVGKGWGQGPQHSKSFHAWFAHLPGLRVAMPATAYDAKGLLLESIFGENPTLIIENRPLYSMVDVVPEEPYRVRFGQAAIRRQGKDVSIIAMGLSVPFALRCAEILEKESIDSEVVDLRTVSPIDKDAVINSVLKTKRLVVVDFGWHYAGVAAEIIAQVAEAYAGILKANPVRVTLPDSHTPMSSALEEKYYFNEETIAQKVRTLFQSKKP
jgi:pyruvate dehydrogenase E1 component beta subunit